MVEAFAEKAKALDLEVDKMHAGLRAYIKPLPIAWIDPIPFDLLEHAPAFPGRKDYYPDSM